MQWMSGLDVTKDKMGGLLERWGIRCVSLYGQMGGWFGGMNAVDE